MLLPRLPVGLVQSAAPVPPRLDRLLGYRGDAPYLAFVGYTAKRTPRCWDGGPDLFAVDWRTWLGWSRHPAVAPHLRPAAAGEWLVLSRADECMYLAREDAVSMLLTNGTRPAPPAAPKRAEISLSDPTGSKERLRAEMTAWLDGYLAGVRSREGAVLS